jgi:LAS superfamily LD-carboxypeptidase LdcB
MPDFPDFTLEQLTGRTRDHLTEITDLRCSLHREVAGPYLAMRAAAAADGIDLAAFSGFRDFDRQLAIWNGKFRGERPMQDRTGRPLDPLSLAPAERVTAILWWSAMPGASRHHWGTDFDVMDPGVLPAGYRLQVIPAEYGPGGPFERLTAWLDDHMHAFGFYRPYTTDRGGVQPEPWHLSYAPVAVRAQRAFSVDALHTVLAASDLEGKQEVLHALAANFASYVVNVDPPPEDALLSPRLA